MHHQWSNTSLLRNELPVWTDFAFVLEENCLQFQSNSLIYFVMFKWLMLLLVKQAKEHNIKCPSRYSFLMWVPLECLETQEPFKKLSSFHRNMGSLFCTAHPDLSSDSWNFLMIEHISRAEKRSENVHLHSLNSQDCDLSLQIPTDNDAPFSVAVISTTWVWLIDQNGKTHSKKRQIKIKKITSEVLSASYDTQLLTLLLLVFSKSWPEIHHN